MVSVAVMKDPDRGYAKGSRAYVYKDVSSVTLCTFGNWCLVAAFTRWRRAAPNVWDRSRRLPDFLPPLRLTPPMPDQVRTWRRLAG